MAKINDLPQASSPLGDETLPIVQGGRTRRTTVAQLTDMASARAEAAAASAEEILQGHSYPSRAAGEEATPEGQFFRVWNGDTPRTYSRYERTAAGSAPVSPLAPTIDLATPASGKGLDLIGEPTVADMLASVFPARGAGSIWHADGHRYREAVIVAADHHLVTAGGVKLYVLPGPDGSYNVRAFGAKGDWDNDTQTGADDQPAFQAACDAAGYSSVVAARVTVPAPEPGKEYYLGSAVELGNHGPVEIHGPNAEARIIRKAGNDYAFTSLVNDWCGVFLGIQGQGSNDPNDNGMTEYYPAILSSKRFKCDVFVAYCGGDNYPGRSEYTANGNQANEPTTGKKRSKCFAVGLVTTEGNGTNYSDITVRAARCGGDAVYIDVESGLRNQNGMLIFVRSAFQVTGYAINNQSGVRNWLRVATAQGHFSQGVIRCADTQNICEISYVEADVGGGYTATDIHGRAFMLEGAQNTCTLTYAPGWAYQGQGGRNEVFALVNGNNRVNVLAPVQFTYDGFNGKRYEGARPDFQNGISIAGIPFDNLASGTDDGTIVGMSNGSTGAALAAAWTTRSIRYEVIGKTCTATITLAGTLTSAQASVLSVTGLGSLFGYSLPAEGMLGTGHIRNVTTGASSKPVFLKKNSTDAAHIVGHDDGLVKKMSDFVAANEQFEVRLSISFVA